MVLQSLSSGKYIPHNKNLIFEFIFLIEFPVHGSFKEDVECMSYKSIQWESPNQSSQSVVEKSTYGR